VNELAVVPVAERAVGAVGPMQQVVVNAVVADGFEVHNPNDA